MKIILNFHKEILKGYRGNIQFKVVSKNEQYQYWFSVDRGNTFAKFAQTSASLLLSNGYTGAYLGIYASSNGQSAGQYADFDWVYYQGYPN